MTDDKKNNPPLDPRENLVYKQLLKDRGEEYAELYLATDEERWAYINWWRSNYNTENDEIKNIGLEPEYFPSLYEAKKFLKELEEEENERKKDEKK